MDDCYDLNDLLGEYQALWNRAFSFLLLWVPMRHMRSLVFCQLACAGNACAIKILMRFFCQFFSTFAIEPLNCFKLDHDTVMSGSGIDFFNHSCIFMPQQISNLSRNLTMFFRLCCKNSLEIVWREALNPKMLKCPFPYSMRM